MKTTIVMSLLVGSALCAPAQISVPADGPVLFGKRQSGISVVINPPGPGFGLNSDAPERIVEADPKFTQDEPTEHQYVPIVREDRVWEYVKYYKNLDDYTVERVRLRFEGTQEVNGIQYHTLIYTGGEKEFFEATFPDDDHLVYKSHGIEHIEESPMWLPCLMREENGILYRYDMELEREMINLDFSLSFSEDGHDRYSFEYSENNSAPYTPGNGTFYLTDVSYMEIEGVECRKMTVVLDQQENYNLDWLDHDFYLIEGIGLVDRIEATGTIAYVGFTLYETGIAQHSNYFLNNVYNLDGDVIYEGTNWSPGAAVDTMPADNMGLSYSGDTLTASAFGGKMTLTVADLSGRMVLREEGSGEVSLDASQLQPGVYVATANTAGRSRTIKIMRK